MNDQTQAAADCIDAQAAEITALRARVAGLEGALIRARAYVSGQNPYSVSGGVRNIALREAISAALSPSAQEARNAE